MTTLVAWAAYAHKSNAPNAIYIATDSRITWATPSRRWDAGRKVFSALTAPHIFGYCGDVVFPSLVLAQIVSAIDCRALIYGAGDPEDKHQTVFEYIKRSFQERHDAPDYDFSIIHAYRSSGWPRPSFAVWHINYEVKSREWFDKIISIPEKTSAFISIGTGAAAATQIRDEQWERSDVAGTSRAIFSAFCDTLRKGADKFSGGPPQVAALSRKDQSMVIGLLKDKKFYLNGLELNPGADLKNIEWRDELFQRIDPGSMTVVPGGRRYFLPRLRQST